METDEPCKPRQLGEDQRKMKKLSRR